MTHHTLDTLVSLDDRLTATIDQLRNTLNSGEVLTECQRAMLTSRLIEALADRQAVYCKLDILVASRLNPLVSLTVNELHSLAQALAVTPDYDMLTHVHTALLTCETTVHTHVAYVNALKLTTRTLLLINTL